MSHWKEELQRIKEDAAESLKKQIGHETDFVWAFYKSGDEWRAIAKDYYDDAEEQGVTLSDYWGRRT